MFDLKEPFIKLINKLQIWLDNVVTILPNFLVAILVLTLFYFIAKLTKNIIYKILKRTINKASLINLFSKTAHISIIAIGVFVALEIVGFHKAVTSLLAGVGVVSLALSFAFQDIASNFVSGIILAFIRPFRKGDMVSIEDNLGRIVKSDLRTTTIETFQGQEVYIPNKDVLQGLVTNYSNTGKRRVDLEVGVSYADDLDKVECITKETLAKLEGVLNTKDIRIDYESFANSSINFTARFWLTTQNEPNFLSVRSKAIKAIKKAYDKHNITIPFPIRTLDFDTKGGEKLDLELFSRNSN